MAHALHLPDGIRPKFDALVPSLVGLLEGEVDRTANLANVAAALFEAFGWHWVGFYRVDGVRDELVLGPFQGPVACTRLVRGRGVCAAAWESGKTLVVPDVEAFPGHVACSALSRSEVVVPMVVGGEVVAVLDVDAAEPDAFREDHVEGLERVVELIASRWNGWS
jgi:GAF domain-containing protein